MHSFFLPSKLILIIIFIHFLICFSDAATVPALFVFGDSIVDTGNNNDIKTIVKVDFPPYGRDFIGGKPTGRFSNGKVPADLIAEGLGIKEILPAYLDPTLKDSDLSTGVNFASGGNGYDPLTSNLVSVLSLSDQLSMFKGYISKLEKSVGPERSSAIISQSLIVVVTGSNDILNTYYGTPLRKLQYNNVSSYADFLVGHASSFVLDLYKVGARRVAMFGLPPLGCLPSQRTLRGGLGRKCVDLYNRVAEMFNDKLSVELETINRISNPFEKVAYVDLYKISIDVMLNPKKYGFEISNKGCCGTGTIEVAFLCKLYACSDDEKYVFWDSFHLTEKAYRLLVGETLKNSIKSFVL